MFQLINEILQHRSPEPNTYAYVLEGMWVILTVNTWLLSALPVFKNLTLAHNMKYWTLKMKGPLFFLTASALSLFQVWSNIIIELFKLYSPFEIKNKKSLPTMQLTLLFFFFIYTPSHSKLDSYLLSGSGKLIHSSECSLEPNIRGESLLFARSHYINQASLVAQR